MKQKIGTVWRHNEERLPGHRLAVVYGGRKGTDDFSLGHIHETYRVVLGKDEHLGKKEKDLSDLALTERQRAEATLGPSSYLLASAHFSHKLPQGKNLVLSPGCCPHSLPAGPGLSGALPACPWGPSLIMNSLSWSCLSGPLISWGL